MKTTMEITSVPAIEEKSKVVSDVRSTWTLSRVCLDWTMVVERAVSSSKVASACEEEAASVTNSISPVEETC